MFKNRKEVILFIALATVAIFMTVGIAEVFAAETLTLEDGSEVPLDGLSDDDKKKMIILTGKISDAQRKAKEVEETVVDTLKEVASDPQALNEWRKVITGTIKDVANDLGVTVNEFVKTPVGMGVAAIIFYKVAGKDFISAAMDVVLAIPMWITIMLACWYIQRQYLTTMVIYESIVEGEDDKGKKRITKSKPKQVYRYNWESKEARTTLACFVYGTMLVITFTCVLLVFVY